MSVRVRFSKASLVGGGLLGAAVIAWAVGAAEKPAGAASETVATVGSIRIPRAEFERQVTKARQDYQRRRGTSVPQEFRAMLSRQILEQMIRFELLVLEAERRGITVSDADAEGQLQRDPFFQTDGAFDANKLRSAKLKYPLAYRDALLKARREGAGRRLSSEIETQQRPEEAKIRAAAERSLTRADLEYMVLKSGSLFSEFPEPRESEILAYYRSHASEFRRPARASLSIIHFSRPGPSGSGAQETQAWERRMKSRADSALAALRSGTTWEDVAEGVGTAHQDVVVLSDNFPGYWRGDARLNAEVFRAKPGTVIAEPIPASPGWLLARVDKSRPAQVAPLAEVAVDIRSLLREEARLRHDHGTLQTMFAARRDSMRGSGFRLRYAAIDSSSMDPGAPSEADLDRYYRGHLADYTSYDAASGSIVSRPLAEVRDDVNRRWSDDERVRMIHDWTDRLEAAWRSGRRDRELEQKATVFREIGPLPSGAPVDSGLIGRAVSRALSQRGYSPGVTVIPSERGSIVVHVYEHLRDYSPTFEQARPYLQALLRDQRTVESERKAKELFERDPAKFGTGRVINYTRVISEPMQHVYVPLTRAEIERHHRAHIEKYSSPELVQARHILVSPTGAEPEADTAARRKAEDLLKRVRAGEDFAALANQYSDDPPTRARGGDLGYFGRGTMLEPVERASFALHAGEVSDVVKSDVGYHIIKVTDHQEMVAEPLNRIYTLVGLDAAEEKAIRLARELADSLHRAVRTPAQVLAAARKLDLTVAHHRHPVGDRNYPVAQHAIFDKLEQLEPGQIYPAVETVKGIGSFIQWPDSITQGGIPDWEVARIKALESYAREANKRTFVAKRAELDSLSKAGWSVDSVAALWGGLQQANSVRPGAGIRGVASAEVIDSLVFGGRRAAALDEGDMSPWIDLPDGVLRVRLKRRQEPDPARLANLIQSERRLALERSLQGFFEDLKRRYPVRILDRELRDTTLPELPKSAASL